MDQALRKQWPIVEQDQRISEAVSRDQSRLRSFIRRRVADPGDAEDILQDVFYELVEAYRMMKPVEQVTAWLFGSPETGSPTCFAEGAGRRYETNRQGSRKMVRSSHSKNFFPPLTPVPPQPTRAACCSKSSTTRSMNYPRSSGKRSSAMK
jgi:Sigma-70 region 2